ncbi:MAG: DUF6502 family protein [Pseudomonadota bacterium]|nr:DUF6502 family protein [Pseudomonadota bacterium]
MRVLRPLVRLALARGITYPAMAEMLKALFVDVARRDFPLEDGAPSDSRVHLLTGIHRKEIKRLREDSVSGEATRPMPVSLGAQLVGAWLGREPYVDAAGRPGALPRLASVGGETSFEALVAGVSKDIRSRAVLDEWQRSSVVSLNEQDEVVLNVAAFVPREDFAAKSHYFAHNLHDHAAAAVHNLLGEGEPWLERSVHYDALTPESIAELNELAQRQGMDLLQSLNRTAQALEERDAQAPPNRRFTCGVYFYSEAAPPAEPPSETPKT